MQQELQVMIVCPDIVPTKTLVIHITCTTEDISGRVYTSRLIVPCRSSHCRLMFVFTCRVVFLEVFTCSVSMEFRVQSEHFFSYAFLLWIFDSFVIVCHKLW